MDAVSLIRDCLMLLLLLFGVVNIVVALVEVVRVMVGNK